MRRRDFIKVIAGATAVCPFVVHAQQQVGKVFHIGVLETTSQAMNGANLDAFRQGLLKSGYVEGQNLVIEYRSGDGREERFPNLAIELARLNVDLILARGTPAALGQECHKNYSNSLSWNRRSCCERHRCQPRAPRGKYYWAKCLRHRIVCKTARAALRVGTPSRTDCVPD
jgi:hypothetical protein